MANYKVTDTELTSIANAIRTKGETQAQLEFPSGFVSAVQSLVPVFSAQDEGKVVSNGVLVAQTAHAKVMQNGTYDTTLNNEIEVDVSGGSSNEWITISSGVLIERDGDDYIITIQTSTAQGITYALGILTSESVRITYVGPTSEGSSGTVQSGTQIKQQGYFATDAIRASTGRLTYNNHSVGDSYVYAPGNYVVYFGVYAGIGGFKFRLSKVTE